MRNKIALLVVLFMMVSAFGCKQAFDLALLPPASLDSVDVDEADVRYAVEFEETYSATMLNVPKGSIIARHRCNLPDKELISAQISYLCTRISLTAEGTPPERLKQIVALSKVYLIVEVLPDGKARVTIRDALGRSKVIENADLESLSSNGNDGEVLRI